MINCFKLHIHNTSRESFPWNERPESFRLDQQCIFYLHFSKLFRKNSNSSENFLSRQHICVVWFQRIKSDKFPLSLSSSGKIWSIQNLSIWHFIINLVFSRIFVKRFLPASPFNYIWLYKLLIIQGSKSQICSVYSYDISCSYQPHNL